MQVADEMNSSVNRFGDGISKPPPEAVDKTRILVAMVMLRRPSIKFEFLPGGSIHFRLPLDNSAMSSSNLEQARLMRTRWFADAVGEYLVRTNLEKLDTFVRRAEFPDLAGLQRHTGFGLWINPDSLQFLFHCSLLNRLFNEHLKWELRGVET